MKFKTEIAAFFGDASYAFKLTPALIPELEHKTGTGIGGLSKRLVANEFKHADISEVIRLGLIGGGMAPETAHRLVLAYADQPLASSYALAVSIMEALFFGVDPAATKDTPQ
jgi:hypothetical protein